jgi:hypothetical protein
MSDYHRILGVVPLPLNHWVNPSNELDPLSIE